MAGDINRVTLVGRLTRDPELRHLPSGTAVLQLGLAVNGRQKDDAGNWIDKPNFFDVKVFGNQAEMLSNHLAKGRRIGVDGRLDWSSWRRRTAASDRRWKSSRTRFSFLTAAKTPRRRRAPVRACRRDGRRRHGRGRNRRRHPLLDGAQQRQRPEGATGRAPAPAGNGTRPAASLLLLQGEDRGGGLEELQPAPPLRLREGEDPLAPDHRHVPPPPAAGRGRGEAGPRDGVAPVRNQLR